MAEQSLRLGHDVVVDAVNGSEKARQTWRTHVGETTWTDVRRRRVDDAAWSDVVLEVDTSAWTGKNTILSMCGAVKQVTRDGVHVLGRKLGRVGIRVLRESVGHVNPRHPLSSPLTVRQVILYPPVWCTPVVVVDELVGCRL